MMHTPQALYEELRKTLSMIDVEIKNANLRIEDLIADSPYPDSKNTTTWVDSHGKSPLEGLLIARATTLAAMAQLKVSTMQPSIPETRTSPGRRGGW